VDIFYGSFRLLWALETTHTFEGWTTYESLGNSPLGGKTFCMCCGMELLFAAAVFGLVLWQMIKTNSTEKLAILIFMGLVLTFPFYVLISSYKREIQSGNFGQVDHCSIIHQFRPVHGLGYTRRCSVGRSTQRDPRNSLMGSSFCYFI
jgi:predicted neutral ceramidase superfamily lipid hydrolase